MLRKRTASDWMICHSSPCCERAVLRSNNATPHTSRRRAEDGARGGRTTVFGPTPYCDAGLRRRDSYCRIKEGGYHRNSYKTFVPIDELPSKRHPDENLIQL